MLRLTKPLMNLWDRFLFRDRGIIPTKRLLFIVLVYSVVLIIGTLFAISWTFVIIFNIIILFVTLFDLFFSAKKKQISFNRKIVEEMERGISYMVEIKIKNNSSHSLKFRFVDGIPQSFRNHFPIYGKVSGNEKERVIYETTALIRGQYELEKLYFRYTSVFGLWEKQITAALPYSVKVIPDLTETKQYLENAQQFLKYEGFKIRKHRSGVSEFAKIRSYVVGDDPRKINWRQTAKLHEVMSNEFEPEHGKIITILLDCGRMMGAELTKGNRLEKVLEAALTVCAAALQKGDSVSVLAFSKDVKVFVPARKGMGHLKTILHAIYDVKVDSVEPNYAQVLQYLETVQKKRSLILLFSDIRTFLYEESVLYYLQRLRQRHLFLMIGIEDEMLLITIKEEPVNPQVAMKKSIAQQEILFIKREKMRWEKQGLQMIEAKEEQLTVTAVSHYFRMINRGLI
ncbi:DUF58 domain-containing protein [Schinkia azotoformans]|uniref:DUF58 domain-containing protein n=1 Tax=Schinkia azotoformans TaxID=1454 RepID=UPI002DBE6892|nr:DUF58 domain-containing protein [Schinkia azotoformans]